MCDDYGIVNAPFSGTLAGPVSRKGPAGNQYDGVKLLNDGKEDKISIQSLEVSAAKGKKLLEIIHHHLKLQLPVLGMFYQPRLTYKSMVISRLLSPSFC